MTSQPGRLIAWVAKDGWHHCKVVIELWLLNFNILKRKVMHCGMNNPKGGYTMKKEGLLGAERDLSRKRPGSTD